MALQMVFRINVGGSLILPAEDTGFFREWSTDDINYFDVEGVVLHNHSLMPNYSKIENYTAQKMSIDLQGPVFIWVGNYQLIRDSITW